MNCFTCPAPAVLFQRYSGRSLCAEHLAADIESRAKRVIRQNGWLIRGDRIGMVTAMAYSGALEHFLSRLTEGRPDITLVSIIASPGDIACTSSWYRSVTRAAASEGCTRIALPFCADDLAEEILSSLLRGDASSLLTKGIPCLNLPVMRPFQEIPGEELILYAQYLNHSPAGRGRDQGRTDSGSFDDGIIELLGNFSSRHPSAPFALRRYREQLQKYVNE